MLVNISNVVLDSLNYAMQHGYMSVDQKRGIITLIPKKDKDKSYLKNWRPISLLNVDYKIAAKILASRLKRHLSDLVDPDQTGFIKGRFIGENIRLIADLLQYTHAKEIPGLLLLIDFEKAFDSLEWSFIYKALSLFGFGDNYIRMVKTLYSDICSCVINNGHASEFFNLERGVRQGCPLSPLLFILSVELLAIAVRKTETIEGIQVKDTVFKMSQFADDTTFFVANEKSAKAVLKLLQDFRYCSGLKVN